MTDQGRRYGRWTVVARGSKPRYVLARCACGTEREVASYSLSAGDSQSCGCLATELRRARNTTHGRTGTPEYRAWKRMLERCYNPKSISYQWYGARGIKVCEAWRRSFPAFLAAMGSRPSPKHRVERLNNGLDYSPQNCVWATAAEQALNRRSNVLLTLRGRTQHLKFWAQELGITPDGIQRRLALGWTVERALTTPKGAKS